MPPTANTTPPDDLSASCVARWIEQGLTSRSHPLLQFALKTFIEPAGMKCESIEIEPFSILETGGVGGLLFSRLSFDPNLVTVPVVRAIVNRYPSLKAEAVGSGHIFFSAPAAAGDPKVTDVDMQELAYEIAEAVSNALRFLLAAALCLVEEGTPIEIKQAFLAGDFPAFCAHVQAPTHE